MSTFVGTHSITISILMAIQRRVFRHTSMKSIHWYPDCVSRPSSNIRCYTMSTQNFPSLYSAVLKRKSPVICFHKYFQNVRLIQGTVLCYDECSWIPNVCFPEMRYIVDHKLTYVLLMISSCIMKWAILYYCKWFRDCWFLCKQINFSKRYGFL